MARVTDTARGSGPRIDVALEKADHFVDIGRYDLAERELQTVLQSSPGNAAAHVLRGRIALKREDPEGAEEAAAEALRLDPSSLGGLAIRAAALQTSGRHRESEATFIEALRRFPRNAALWVAYGHLLFKTGHRAKAEAVARQALELDPESRGAHGLLGVVLSGGWRSKLGMRHGEKGIALAPGEDASHLMLGATYLRSGRPFRARRHLREALRLDPSDADVEELWQDADRYCRVVALPYYYTSLLLERIPGGQVVLWLGFVLGLAALRQSGVSPVTAGVIGGAYLLFCIYTWVAEPLSRAWVRMLPPR